MACVSVQLPAVPSLPDPFTFGVDPPSFSGDLAVCCKILAFSITPPPIALGAPLLAPINAAIEAFVAGVEAYIDALPLECPKE